jgi:TatD DNase family protein
MRLFDAHNHLQDDRFAGRRGEVVAACRAAGVVRMVVNGSCEADWPAVLGLARDYPDLVLPSFGYHPWYVGERTSGWRLVLTQCAGAVSSVVGEIGLDRWKSGLSYEGQEEVFVWQLRWAAERNVAASIHCLRAWGRLEGLLRENPRPDRGFLLHSYGGPVERIAPLVKLGAYFSLPGAFAHARRQRQREVFLEIPRERLLIETDAPDQGLPDERDRHAWVDEATGRRINHPANLVGVFEFAAELLGESAERLAVQLEANFQRLFG